MNFSFNEIEFNVEVVENRIFDIVRLTEFEEEKKEREWGHNKVVYLGGGNSCYVSEKCKIVK